MIVQRIWMLVAEAASNLPPSYFSLVMATGIVSIAAYVSELKVTSWLLFEINKVAYASLLSFTLIRAVGYFPRLRTDLVSHTRGPGLLTMIAATSILGSQFVVLDRSFGVASGLWLFAVVLWCCLMYAFLAAMTIGKRKPNLEAGLDGDWLITVVATQSISLLGT